MSRHDEANVKRVTRYVIHEQDFDDTKSSYTTRSNYTTRTQREPEKPRSSVPEYVTKEINVRREATSPRSETWEKKFYDDQDEREIVISRRVETAEPKREERDLTITRVEERDDESRRDREVASPRDAHWERDPRLQHYTRTYDYYDEPQRPTTIIIKQEPTPIIIHDGHYDGRRRGEREEDGYQIVRASDYDERSVARREDDSREVERYSYYKRESGYDDRDHSEERHNRDRGRRERSDSIDQWDSISNDGRRRDSDFSDDQTIVYVKKKNVTKEEYGSREASPDRRKNLAAGAIAGVGAAELIRSHRRKEGRETSHGIGRVGRDVGAGALGALAAEGIQRARSLHREKSRHRGSRDRDSDRSESGDRDRRHGRRRSRRRSESRSRSRSHSRSKLKTLGVIGLGAAAVAAAATIASKKIKENNNKEEPERRRSRSRRRRGSVQSLEELENDSTANDARNPKHRNSRIAAAGAMGAAGAALIERARSQSKKNEGRSRSRSRIRQGLPIAAAGLGTAALAGLYEKNRAKREAEKIQHEQKHEARHERDYSREDSRARSESAYRDGAREAPPQQGFDPKYIEYGRDPMPGKNYGPGYFATPQAPGYESQAMVPAEAPRGGTRSSRSPSRSVSRDRGRRPVSPSDSEDHHNQRRSRDGIAMAAAAAAGGVAASEYERVKQEKRERKARKREQERGGYDRHEDGYGPQQFESPTPPPAHDPYASASGFYSSTSPLPPPPGQLPQQQPYTNNGFPQAFPNSATPQPQPAMAPQGIPQNTYQPPTNDTFGSAQHYDYPHDPYGAQNFPQPNPPHPGYDQPYQPGPDPYATSRSRGADENVSAGSPFPQNAPSNQQQAHPDGVEGQPENQPPSINIIPPSLNPSTPTASNPNLTVPPTYEPPTEHEETPSGKHVQFATSSTSEPSRTRSASNLRATDAEAMSPDDRRRRRHRTETAQGYEASEDTDTSPADDPRSRAYDTRPDRDRNAPGNRSRSNSNRERERDRDGDHDQNSRDRDRSRRKDQEKDHERSRDRDYDYDRSKDSRRSSRRKSRRNDDDGDDSDATIELEPRFDEKGRKRAERGEDPVADKIDDILAGKGAAGKVLGNFMDGLLGDKNKSGDNKDRRGKSRRD